MKKALFLAILAFTVHSIYAQTQKGKIFLGGTSQLSANFSSNRYEYDGHELGKDKGSTFNINPGFGYFFADNFMFGLNANMMILTSDDIKATNIAVGPAARLYLGNSSRIKPFLVGQLGFEFSKNTYHQDTDFETIDETSKANGIGYGLGVGMAFFFNEHIAFDVILGYNASSATDSNDSKIKSYSNTTSVGIGFSFHL